MIHSIYKNVGRRVRLYTFAPPSPRSRGDSQNFQSLSLQKRHKLKKACLHTPRVRGDRTRPDRKIWPLFICEASYERKTTIGLPPPFDVTIIEFYPQTSAGCDLLTLDLSEYLPHTARACRTPMPLCWRRPILHDTAITNIYPSGPHRTSV
jgi:hypothetical protein